MLWFEKGEDTDVVDLILYSVPNTLHAQPHVGKRQNTSLGYVDCIIQHRQTHTHRHTHTHDENITSTAYVGGNKHEGKLN